MSWKTALAIYTQFWVMSAFLVLPFEARAKAGGEVTPVPGQEAGAPAGFRPGRAVARTTLVSAVIFALFYANYLNGWVTTEMLDFGRGR